MTAERNGESFKPSWIDRFTNWVETLSVRPWIFYLVFGIVLILVQIFFGLHYLAAKLVLEEIPPRLWA